MITPAYALTATERVLPRLVLDFTTATLDPRVTVTRALNTATRINSSGLIETVNADLPRFDYDPATLLCRGLLIEETRANFLLHSSGANQSAWTKDASGTGVAPVVTPNFAVAPDGTTTANRLQFNRGAGTTVNDASRLFQFVGGTDTRTATVYLKSNDSNTYSLQLLTGSNVQAISVTPNNFTRFLVSGATGSNFILRLVGSVDASTTADILFWGAQLETDAFATSYIPTTTTSLTRNADAVSMTGTNFSDWYNASEGTFAITSSTVNLAANRPIMQTATSGLSTGSQYVYYNPASSRFGYRVYDATGVAVGAVNYTNAGTPTINTIYCTVIGYKTDSFVISANGAAVGLDTTGTMSGTANTLLIGSDTASTYLNGHVKKLSFYTQRLLDAETQAFSKG